MKSPPRAPPVHAMQDCTGSGFNRTLMATLNPNGILSAREAHVSAEQCLRNAHRSRFRESSDPWLLSVRHAPGLSVRLAH